MLLDAKVAFYVADAADEGERDCAADGDGGDCACRLLPGSLVGWEVLACYVM